MPRPSRSLPLYLAVLTLCLVSVGSAQSTYTITDLGTLGGSLSSGLGINSSGQVVGYSNTAGDTAHHAFLISSPYTSMTDLGTLNASYSLASGINTSGQVVGYNGFFGDGTFRAFLISSPYSTMTDLGTLGGDTSIADAINASGQVVGGADLAGNTASHAFVLSSPYTSMTDLGTLGGSNSFAYAINASGQVAGWAYLAGNTAIHAFLISSPYTTMTDLGTLGGNFISPVGINASGQVVGGSSLAGEAATHAFLISPPYTTMNDLGTLGGTFSAAWGINASSQVVGQSSITGNTAYHAFLYTSANGMVDLNALLPSGSGWTLLQADAINDAGQITGFGTNPSGFTHAFLLSPGADLSIRKSGAPKVKSGGNLNYAIAVANKGPNNASGVTVTDTLPGGTTFVSATPTQGSCTGTSTVTCNLGTIAASGGASVSLVVHVTAPAGSTIRNTATVTGRVTDPNTANNTSTLATSVF
jgi:uncharacterized repeat protein (TIGR01451 family)